MQRHVYRVPVDGQDRWLFLCSDLHLGSPGFDLKRWQADMDAAKRVDAKVIVNGDIFDAIAIGDKRFTPDCLIPELQGKRDLAGAVSDYAVKLFEPYRSLLHILGSGNHEETWQKRYGYDPTARLIGVLNDKPGDTIRHGGISGWYRTRFVWPAKGSPSVAHTLWYHHGSGGDAPVTKGAIEFSRMESRWDADAYTMGHKHWRTVSIGARGYLSEHDHTRRRETLLIQTGSYLLNHMDGEQETPTHYMYAESSNHPPKPMGGWFLRLRPMVGDRRRWVQQDVLTEP